MDEVELRVDADDSMNEEAIECERGWRIGGRERIQQIDDGDE